MGTIKAVTVPRWGMTMTEGTIVRWMSPEGEAVVKGQELIEIETTKVTNVVEATADGILRRVVLGEGTTAPVGALAGVIADAAAAEVDIDEFVASYADRMGSADGDGEKPPEPRTVTVGDGVVSLLEVGPEGEDVVLFLHGFGGDLSTWLFNQPAIAETRRTVALDLPGHGGSTPLAEEDAFAAMVARITAVIDTAVPGRIHFVGHSLGGGVAAAVAAARPERMASLTLIAPIGLGQEIDRSFLEDFVAAERRRPLQGVLERLFADPSRMTSDMVEGVLRFKRLEGVPEALGRLAGSIAGAEGQRQSIAGHLAGLGWPVTLIWGEADVIVPVPSAVPEGAVLRVIPDAGHMPQMEAASDVNEAILETIERAG